MRSSVLLTCVRGDIFDDSDGDSYMQNISQTCYEQEVHSQPMMKENFWSFLLQLKELLNFLLIQYSENNELELISLFS